MLDTGFHITYTKQCISSKELFVNVKQEKKEVSIQHCNLPGQVGTGLLWPIAIILYMVTVQLISFPKEVRKEIGIWNS